MDLDRVRAHPAGAGVPALASLVLDQAHHRFPCFASVVRPEERPRRGAEPDRVAVTRLDVPGLLEREPGLLGQAESLASLPRLAAVVRALDGRAVDPVVRGRVERAVCLDRVEAL